MMWDARSLFAKFKLIKAYHKHRVPLIQSFSVQRGERARQASLVMHRLLHTCCICMRATIEIRSLDGHFGINWSFAQVDLRAQLYWTSTLFHT